MPSIVVKDVNKTFQLQTSSLKVLDGMSFEVEDCEFVSIIGPSGCRKSTILRLIADIIPVTKGEIKLHGLTPSEARKKQLFSFVFQDPVLLPWRSCLKNVELPLEMMSSQERKKYDGKAMELLKLVGLDGFEKVNPSQLSGGMKQRAAIARALLQNPSILLMDEPFGALDEITRDKMNLELLRIWHEIKTAVLFVTHSIDEAVFLSDRVLVLTSHPGFVFKEIKIDLPRPRTRVIRQSEEAFSYSSEVRKALAESVAYMENSQKEDNSDVVLTNVA